MRSHADSFLQRQARPQHRSSSSHNRRRCAVRRFALIELDAIRDIGIAHSEAIESTDVNRY
jgi:hypothetical protein